MTGFFRFPHTPHLLWLGMNEPRDDKVMSAFEAQAVLSGEVVVEEKLDGANLGFSLSDEGELVAQNRGQYLLQPYGGQFTRLGAWLSVHGETLFDALEPHLIVFGEWCAALHSLDYTALPDWWLLFDVYDRNEARFWSTARRNSWAERAGLGVVPPLFKGHTTIPILKQMIRTQMSRFRAGPMEGVVVRSEDALWLRDRSKLVRAEFTQHIDQHWRDRSLVWNRLEKIR